MNTLTAALPVQVNQVSFRYGPNPVLENVSLEIEQGDFVGLIGPNGGGKTTLLKIILGLIRPEGGDVRLFGESPTQGRSLVGYVPQHVRFDREFPISVKDVVLMGRMRHAPALGRYKAEDREAADQAMEEMEVQELRDRSVGELSGGQFQRVIIARALASRPRLLAMDEPTNNVDSRFQQEIPEILKRLNQKMTIIMISHDLGFVTAYVNKVACLNSKLICHPTASIKGEMIEELYAGHVHLVDHGDHRHCEKCDEEKQG